MLKRWNNNEINILYDLYPNTPLSELSTIFKKSPAAIRTKANRLKIYRAFSFNDFHKSIPIEIKSYLAGHFDGEGCIRFRKKGKIFSPIVIVSICSLETLLLYKKFFDGAIKPLLNKKGKKPMHRWTLVKFNNIWNLCQSFIPYSIEKKRQLLLATEHLEEWLSVGNRSNPGNNLRENSKNRSNKSSYFKRLTL